MIKRRRTAVLGAFAVVASVFLLPASPAKAVTFDNACVNSLIPTQASLIPITMTADASPNPVPTGGTVTLSNIQQSAAIPPAVFVAGYNAGVLHTGVNNVPVTDVHSVIAGTNTVEGTQTTNSVATTATTTITDPDTFPGTGDETATPGTLSVTYADETWTAGTSAGSMDFREFTTTPPVTTTTGGINITAVVAGIITVRFGCDPGEVVESAPPSTIVYTDPAATFASTQVFVPPDAAGAVTVNGPVKAGATTKSYKVKVTNEGIQPITVDPTTGQITGSVTVNGAPNGAVVSTSTKVKTINPGHSTTFGLDWTGGPVASGDSVVFTGCVNLAGDFNTANDCSNSTVSVK